MKRLFVFLLLFVTSGSICIVSAQDNKKSKSWDYWNDRITINGYAQIVYQYDSYDTCKQGPFNSFNIYRAMLTTKIEPVNHLYIGFMADLSKFKPHELYAEYRPMKFFGIKFGQFKTPFSLENNLSPSVLEIITGAKSVKYLAGMDGSDDCFGTGAGRDLGLEISGSFLKVGKDNHPLFKYRIGVFNGEPFNTKETNNHKDISAMLSISPVAGFDISGSVYFGQATARVDNSYGAFSKGEQYRRDRWSIGVKLDRGPVAFRSEYLEGLDANVKSRGAYATLLGRTCKYIDVVTSVDYLNKNCKVNDWQCTYTCGVQWNIYYRCRLQIQYAYWQRPVNERNDKTSSIPSSHWVFAQLQVGF